MTLTFELKKKINKIDTMHATKFYSELNDIIYIIKGSTPNTKIDINNCFKFEHSQLIDGEFFYIFFFESLVFLVM